MDSWGKPAIVLLDRDGVITEPVLDPRTGTFESPLDPHDVRLVEGAAEAIADLQRLKFEVAVVSNQPAAAKGTVDRSTLEQVHAACVSDLAAAGVSIGRWLYCLHHPDGTDPALTRSCACRKPRPGLLQMALDDANVEPRRAWMVGDADTDVVAGQAAGVQTALIEHPLTYHRRKPGAVRPDLRADSLGDLVERLREGTPARPSSSGHGGSQA